MLREATVSDIPQIQRVRHLVKENILSNPSLVTDEDCREYLLVRGKGWVYEMDEILVGFAIADLKENNVWALFVDPEFEGKGIGKKLHRQMLDWYFSTGKKEIWLGTEPNTRAADFYRKQGWRETGKHGDLEIKFELNPREWQQIHK